MSHPVSARWAEACVAACSGGRLLRWHAGGRGRVSTPEWWQGTSPACLQLPACPGGWVGGWGHGWPLSHACRCHCPPAVPRRAAKGWKGAGSWRLRFAVPMGSLACGSEGKGEAAPQGAGAAVGEGVARKGVSLSITLRGG